MDSLNNQEKRAKLNAIWITAQRLGNPLLISLQNFLIDQDSNFGTGRTVLSHAGAGKNTVLANPAPGQKRQHGAYYELAQEFIDLYNQVIFSIQTLASIAVPPVTSPDVSDPTVFSQMMDTLPVIDREFKDFTYLLAFPR